MIYYVIVLIKYLLILLSKEVKDNKRKIISTFAGFKIHVDKILSTIGVNFTLYEISPQPGVRIARIKRLQDDIALCLGTRGVRIVAPLPNKNTIGSRKFLTKYAPHLV